ncbi:hypothetical protein [uncultured Sphingomonas sp.]
MMQSRSLDSRTQAEALLIVADADGGRRVYGRRAIDALVRRG